MIALTLLVVANIGSVILSLAAGNEIAELVERGVIRGIRFW